MEDIKIDKNINIKGDNYMLGKIKNISEIKDLQLDLMNWYEEHKWD